MGEHMSSVKTIVDRLRLKKSSTIFNFDSEGTFGRSSVAEESPGYDVTSFPVGVQMRRKVNNRGADSGLKSPRLQSDHVLPSVAERTSAWENLSCTGSKQGAKGSYGTGPSRGTRGSQVAGSSQVASVSVRKTSNPSKRKLSVTKSMPLSPTSPRSLEKEMAQYHDAQLTLDKLNAELIDMRRADEDLAKRLLNIHSEIQRLKMARSCLNYCRLLDDAFMEAELADEVPDMCDPAHKSINKVLMERGVTGFNISSRRFSCI